MAPRKKEIRMSHASQCMAMCLSHFGCFMSPLTSLTPSILGSGCSGGVINFGGRSSQLSSLLPYRYRVSVPASKTHGQIYLCTLVQTFENCMRSLCAGSDCSCKQALTCVALTRERLLICAMHNAIYT